MVSALAPTCTPTRTGRLSGVPGGFEAMRWFPEYLRLYNVYNKGIRDENGSIDEWGLGKDWCRKT